MAAHSYQPVPESAVEKVKRHPKYYLNGGDVHFLVSLLIATYTLISPYRADGRAL